MQVIFTPISILKSGELLTLTPWEKGGIMKRKLRRPLSLAASGTLLGVFASLGFLSLVPATAATGTKTVIANQGATGISPWKVSGTVNVGNLPSTQPVSGTVNVGNLPSTQPVSGTVGINPTANGVTVTNLGGVIPPSTGTATPPPAGFPLPHVSAESATIPGNSTQDWQFYTAPYRSIRLLYVANSTATITLSSEINVPTAAAFQIASFSSTPLALATAGPYDVPGAITDLSISNPNVGSISFNFALEGSS